MGNSLEHVSRSKPDDIADGATTKIVVSYDIDADTDLLIGSLDGRHRVEPRSTTLRAAELATTLTLTVTRSQGTAPGGLCILTFAFAGGIPMFSAVRVR